MRASRSVGLLPYDVEKGDPRVYEVSEMHATLKIPTFKLCFSFRVEFSSQRSFLSLRLSAKFWPVCLLLPAVIPALARRPLCVSSFMLIHGRFMITAGVG